MYFADFLFKNLQIPKRKIPLSEALREKGFSYIENRMTGVGKFVKECNFIILDILILIASLDNTTPRLSTKA